MLTPRFDAHIITQLPWFWGRRVDRLKGGKRSVQQRFIRVILLPQAVVIQRRGRALCWLLGIIQILVNKVSAAEKFF